MTDRDERIETYYHNGTRELAEWVVDLEDEVERLKNLNKELARYGARMVGRLEKVELDPSRLEATLRLYVSELDYSTHKWIESGGGVDTYPEEVDFFLRCWDLAGEG